MVDYRRAMETLRQLNVQQALALELHYIFGYTLQEAAELMEFSTAKLKRQLQAARNWLENELNRPHE